MMDKVLNMFQDKVISMAQDIINGSWQLQLAAGVLMAIVCILFITMVYQVVDFVRISQLTDKQSQVLAAKTTNSNKQTLDSVIKSAIFGTYVEHKVAKVNTTLRLLGIMNAAQRDYRRAFIAEPGHDAVVYFEGDEVSKGLKVHKIESDKVTLLRYRKPEILYISWDEQDAFAKRPSVASSKVKKSRASTHRRSTPTSKFDREEYMRKMKDRMERMKSEYPGFKQFNNQGGFNRGNLGRGRQ